MTFSTKYVLITLLSVVAILLGACGSAANETAIATSVAMTVQAQNSLTAAALPTSTLRAVASSTPPSLASITPLTTKAPPTAPTGSALCTASASFVSETIPDGTITNPGAVFTKTWRIKNTGTCPWNSSWKFVYVSGDLMGGATVYNFPAPAAPGDTVDVPVVFTAPTDNGSYRGYWAIQSPWGMVFGDSGSGNDFWVDIVVGSGTVANNKTQSAYDVTSVSYESDVSLIRRCTTANTFYHYIAYISTNGPVTVKYRFFQSDGNNSNNGTITFGSATTQSVSADWSQKIGSSTNPRWVQLVELSPSYHEFAQFTLPILCSQVP